MFAVLAEKICLRHINFDVGVDFDPFYLKANLGF